MGRRAARGLFDDEAEPQVGQLILVLSEGRAVATAQLDLHQHDRYAGLAEVGWVAVVPRLQGRRLGSVVTQAVIGEAEEQGRREVFLRTDDWRLPAVVSYLRLGFRPWLIEPTALERWRLVFGQLDLPASAMGERALQRPGNLAKRAIAGRRQGTLELQATCGTIRGEGMARQHDDIGIIGAGIVGLSCAYELACQGAGQVVVFDEGGPVFGTRAGRRA